MFDCAWQHSKTGTEAMTVGGDGRVLWWDTRRMAAPLEQLPLLDARMAPVPVGAVRPAPAAWAPPCSSCPCWTPA